MAGSRVTRLPVGVSGLGVFESDDLLIEVEHAATGDGQALGPLVAVLLLGVTFLGDANGFAVELLAEEGALGAGGTGASPLAPVAADGTRLGEVGEGGSGGERRRLEGAIAEIDGEGVSAGDEVASQILSAIVGDGAWSEAGGIAGAANELPANDWATTLIPICFLFVAEAFWGNAEGDGDRVVTLGGDVGDRRRGEGKQRERLEGSEIGEVVLDGGEGVIEEGDAIGPWVVGIMGGLGTLEIKGELLAAGAQFGDGSGRLGSDRGQRLARRGKFAPVGLHGLHGGGVGHGLRSLQELGFEVPTWHGCSSVGGECGMGGSGGDVLGRHGLTGVRSGATIAGR